jgi:hypothetical protein
MINYRRYKLQLEDKPEVLEYQETYGLSINQSSLMVALERAFLETGKTRIRVSYSKGFHPTRTINSLVKAGLIFNSYHIRHRLYFDITLYGQCSFEMPKETFKPFQPTHNNSINDINISFEYNGYTLYIRKTSTADNHYEHESFMLKHATYNPKHSGHMSDTSKDIYYPDAKHHYKSNIVARDYHALNTLQMKNGFCLYPQTNK